LKREYNEYIARIEYNMEHNRTCTLPQSLIWYKKARALYEISKKDNKYEMTIKPAMKIIEKFKSRLEERYKTVEEVHDTHRFTMDVTKKFDSSKIGLNRVS
jgi:hypothetical protein